MKSKATGDSKRNDSPAQYNPRIRSQSVCLQNLPLPSCLSCSLPEQFFQFVVLVMAAHHYQFSQHYRCPCRLVSLHKELKKKFNESSITRTKSLDPPQIDGKNPKTYKYVYIFGFAKLFNNTNLMQISYNSPPPPSPPLISPLFY